MPSIGTNEMCSGVCSEEAKLCDPDNLKCIGHGYDATDYAYIWAEDYTDKSAGLEQTSTILQSSGLCHDCPNVFDLHGPQTGLVLPPSTPNCWG